MTRTHAALEPVAPRVITSIAELRAAIDAARAASAPFGGSAGSPGSPGSPGSVGSAGAQVALVPTMGALHDGHLSLVTKAVAVADIVVVSIFVNPLQFGPDEDFDRYPQTLGADVAALAHSGVDFVFAPTAAEMYPHGAAMTRVTAGPVAGLYEGQSRPGHFDGVLTVVSKLLNIVRPDTVLFGQKDAQQIYLVDQMVRDLNIPVEIEAVSIVREEDGLALSSRNRFLRPEAHDAALTLSNALLAAASSRLAGVTAMRQAALAVFVDVPLVKLDYLEIVHPVTFLPVDDEYRGDARVLVAALVDSIRLIDNQKVVIGATTDE